MAGQRPIETRMRPQQAACVDGKGKGAGDGDGDADVDWKAAGDGTETASRAWTGSAECEWTLRQLTMTGDEDN